jgi:NADH-quinone oxidoreductase subunit M
MQDILLSQKLMLGVLVVLIFLFGVYPQPLLDLTKDTVAALLTRFK